MQVRNAVCKILTFSLDYKFLLSGAFYLSEYFPLFLWQVDPHGAQEKVVEIAGSLGLNISVAVAHEVSITNTGNQ